MTFMTFCPLRQDCMMTGGGADMAFYIYDRGDEEQLRLGGSDSRTPLLRFKKFLKNRSENY